MCHPWTSHHPQRKRQKNIQPLNRRQVTALPRPWRKQQDNKAKLRQVSYGYKDGGDQTARRVPWNKTLDTIEVAFPAPIVKVTKREILRKISKTYDLLRLASPITLAGKMLYRETCDARVPWDCDLPRELKNAWESWERLPTGKVEVRRSLVEYREDLKYRPSRFWRCW